jgi:hypothetical protein
MALDKLYSHSLGEEIEALSSLVESEGWPVLKKMLHDHKKYLQEQVNVALLKHDDRIAGEKLSAMKEVDKLIDLVVNRLILLRQENNNQ